MDIILVFLVLSIGTVFTVHFRVISYFIRYVDTMHFIFIFFNMFFIHI